MTALADVRNTILLFRAAISKYHLSVLGSDRRYLRRAVQSVFRSRLRFIIPIVLVGIAKIHGSFWTYEKSIQDGIFRTPWMNLWGEAIEPNWLYVFMAWDTSWYVTLARSLSFNATFFPGYPFLIRLFADVVGNYWLVAFLISLILGLASLPIFQAVAENYMTKSEAVGSTVIMSFFPYVFLFTTVAYTESLFLFAAVSTWYFHMKNRVFPAILFSVVTALTKTYGIVIILPILLDSIVRRRWRRALLTSVPVLLMVAIVLPYTHSDLLIRLIKELNAATWNVSRVTLGNFWFRDYIIPVFTSQRPMSFFHFFHAYALAFIVLVGYLAVNSFKTDWRLGIYSMAMFTMIMMFSYTNGLIRYTSFIFPIWLGVKIRNPAAIAFLAILFYVHSLVLWNQFLWAPYPM